MLIEDESKERVPSVSNLNNMIVETCKDEKDFKINAMRSSITAKSPQNCFVIRHFSKEVCYSTVRFILVDMTFFLKFQMINAGMMKK